jgi:hypothetical protein
MSFFHRWCVFTKHFWFGSDEPFFFFLSSKEKSGMSVSLILLMLFLVRVFFTISPLILGWFGIGFCNYFWFAFHSAILVIWFGLQAWQVNPGLGCFLLSFLLIFFLNFMLLLWYSISEASVQSQGFMSSAGRWPVVRVLGR